MKIKKFEQINEGVELMNFDEAFNQFIKGIMVHGYVDYPAYGDMSTPADRRFYGNGILLENNYMLLHHGGGCSGEDCNTSFIVNDDDILIARLNW